VRMGVQTQSDDDIWQPFFGGAIGSNPFPMPFLRWDLIRQREREEAAASESKYSPNTRLLIGADA